MITIDRTMSNRKIYIRGDVRVGRLIDEDGEPNRAYWRWRQLGFDNEYAVRYPVGNGKHRNTCLYSLEYKGGLKLTYVEARKQIYLNVYCDLVKKEKKFMKLKDRLWRGENLLIIEVDGPHEEDDFIKEDTILCSEDNLQVMLNDRKHPFGHGYCLAIALLGMSYSDR